MKLSTLQPRVHLHVCTHRRPDDDALGPGCGGRGDAVFAALTAERARRGLRDVWLARSSCLGPCPRTGCTTALGSRHWVEVTPGDAAALLEEATRGGP